MLGRACPGRGRRVALVAVAGVVAAVVAVFPGSPASAQACGAATVAVTRMSGPTLYLEPGTLNSAYALYEISNASGAAYSDLWVQIGSFAGPRIGPAPSESGWAHVGALADGAAAHAAFYLTAGGATASAESHQVSVYTTRPDLAGGALCQASFSMTAAEDIAAAANKVDSVTYSATPQLGGQLMITVRGNTGTIGAAGDATVTPASYATWPSNAYRLTGSQITLTGGNTGVFHDDLYLSALNSAATAYTAEFTFAVVGATASPTVVSPMSHIASGAQVKHTSTSNFGTLAPIPQVVNTTTVEMTASPESLPSSGGTGTYTVTVTNEGAQPITLDDITVSIPPGATYVPGLGDLRRGPHRRPEHQRQRRHLPVRAGRAGRRQQGPDR